MPTATSEFVAAIVLEYDLPVEFAPSLEWIGASGLRHGLAATETSKVALLSSGPARWLVKRIPWYCDDVENLRFSHGLQTRLRSEGFPSPRILHTRRGGTWLEFEEGKYALFEFISGSVFDGSRRKVESAGRTLGELHRLSLFPSEVPSEDLFELIGDHLDLLEEILANVGPSQAADEIVSALRYILSDAGGGALRAGFGELPNLAVHGDVNPWNFVFEDGEDTAWLVDFDNCGIGPVVHDIAEALLTFGAIQYRGQSTNFADAPVKEFDFERAGQFLSGYRAARAINARECSVLPYVMTGVYVELSALGIIRGDYGPDTWPEIPKWVDSMVPQVSAWLSDVVSD